MKTIWLRDKDNEFIRFFHAFFGIEKFKKKRVHKAGPLPPVLEVVLYVRVLDQVLHALGQLPLRLLGAAVVCGAPEEQGPLLFSVFPRGSGRVVP